MFTRKHLDQKLEMKVYRSIQRRHQRKRKWNSSRGEIQLPCSISSLREPQWRFANQITDFAKWNFAGYRVESPVSTTTGILRNGNGDSPNSTQREYRSIQILRKTYWSLHHLCFLQIFLQFYILPKAFGTIVHTMLSALYSALFTQFVYACNIFLYMHK